MMFWAQGWGIVYYNYKKGSPKNSPSIGSYLGFSIIASDFIASHFGPLELRRVSEILLLRRWEGKHWTRYLTGR